MRNKIYTLVFLTLLLVSTSLINTTTVKAKDTKEATQTTEESGSVDKKSVKKIKKDIKVNDTLSVKKALKLKKVKNYTFKSSAKKVASVSEKGVITGNREGKATITVTSTKDNSTVATITVKVKNRYTAEQLRYMASIISSEARGECYAGQKAVGIVVLNRVKSNLYPNDIKSVLYQRSQFTPAANGSLSNSLARYDKGTLEKSCIKAAKEVLNGDTTVNYGGKVVDLKGYLFFSRYVANKKLTIQHHDFK